MKRRRRKNEIRVWNERSNKSMDLKDYEFLRKDRGIHSFMNPPARFSNSPPARPNISSLNLTIIYLRHRKPLAIIELQTLRRQRCEMKSDEVGVVAVKIKRDSARNKGIGSAEAMLRRNSDRAISKSRYNARHRARNWMDVWKIQPDEKISKMHWIGLEVAQKV